MAEIINNEFVKDLVDSGVLGEKDDNIFPNFYPLNRCPSQSELEAMVYATNDGTFEPNELITKVDAETWEWRGVDGYCEQEPSSTNPPSTPSLSFSQINYEAFVDYRVTESIPDSGLTIIQYQFKLVSQYGKITTYTLSTHGTIRIPQERSCYFWDDTKVRALDSNGKYSEWSNEVRGYALPKHPYYTNTVISIRTIIEDAFPTDVFAEHICWTGDGMHFIASVDLDGTSAGIYAYPVTEAFNSDTFQSASFGEVVQYVGDNSGQFYCSNDGNRWLAVSRIRTIKQYDGTTGWGVNPNHTFTQEAEVTGFQTGDYIKSRAMSIDGKKLFLSKENHSTIYRYPLATSHEITPNTLTHDQMLKLEDHTEFDSPEGNPIVKIFYIDIIDSGNVLLVNGRDSESGNYFIRIYLATAYDLLSFSAVEWKGINSSPNINRPAYPLTLDPPNENGCFPLVIVSSGDFMGDIGTLTFV